MIAHMGRTVRTNSYPSPNIGVTDWGSRCSSWNVHLDKAVKIVKLIKSVLNIEKELSVHIACVYQMQNATITAF